MLFGCLIQVEVWLKLKFNLFAVTCARNELHSICREVDVVLLRSSACFTRPIFSSPCFGPPAAINSPIC